MVKKNQIMKSAGKGTKPETAILSELTQTQKEKCCMCSLFVDASFDSSGVCVPFGIPTEIGKLVKAYVGCFQGSRDRTQC